METQKEEISLKDAITDLKRMYVTIGSPIAFRSPVTVYNYYKKRIPLKTIKKILSSINTYTLHHENHKRQRHYNMYFVRLPFDTLEMDLVSMYESLSRFNDSTKYLFCIVDVFTRYAFVRAIKSKDEESMIKAFKSMYQDIKRIGKRKPRVVISDLGSEFMSRKFKAILDKYNLTHKNPKALLKGAYVGKRLKKKKKE